MTQHLPDPTDWGLTRWNYPLDEGHSPAHWHCFALLVKQGLNLNHRKKFKVIFSTQTHFGLRLIYFTLRNNSKNWANESTLLNQTVGIGVREIYAKVRPGVWAVVPRFQGPRGQSPLDINWWPGRPCGKEDDRCPYLLGFFNSKHTTHEHFLT